MKKGLLFIFLYIFYSGCNSLFTSNSKGVDNVPMEFYESGEIIIHKAVEEIAIQMINGLPICKTQINGKEYRFLIDTGALTVISEEIFKELNLKTIYTANFGDFNNKSQVSKYTYLPSLKINNVEFKDFACVVLNIDKTLSCFYDGIIGANMMVKLKWKFDYQNSKVWVGENLSDLEFNDYDFIMGFGVQKQKTPVIKGNVSGKTLSFLFDTGYSGNIQVPNEYDFYKGISAEGKFITSTGIQSIGLRGPAKYTKSFIMKYDLQLDKEAFDNELIRGGSKAIFGNGFLENYVFLMDWNYQKVYFKRNSTVKQNSLIDFGFTYLFIGNKLTVARLIEEASLPLKLGDKILSMNGKDYTNVENICDYLLKDEKKKEAASI